MSRRFVRFSALLGVLAATALAACSSDDQNATPQEVFDSYVVAVNTSDIRAVEALISEQVERNDYPRCMPTMSNKACLLLYVNDTVVGVDGRITTLRTEVSGDTVTARLEVATRTARNFGLQRIVGDDVVTVRDGLITSFRFVPECADAQTVAFFTRLGGVNPCAAPRVPSGAPDGPASAPAGQL